ncbi:MAG: histidine kinase [Bacteroidetes bacterium]|nr:histidine kinase [Bacteroidota bacterium]
MLKWLPFLLYPMLCLFSCGDSQQEFTVEGIANTHQQLDSLSTDSILPTLKKLELALSTNELLPDSLRAENNYRIGLHYKKLNKLDSAAIFFHLAVDFVNDSIKNDRQIHYFESAFDTQYNLGIYANCFTISEKFKSLLDPERQFYWLSLAYYWEERVHVLRQDYNKALSTNEERIKIAKEKDTVNLLPEALLAKADLLYYSFTKKQEASSILESLIKEEAKWSPISKRRIYTNYGVYKYYAGEFQEAYELYLKALVNAKQVESGPKVNGIANCYNNIAEVLLDLKRYEAARKYMDSTRLLGVDNLNKGAQKSLLNYELRLAVESSKNSSSVREIHQEIYNHQDEIYRLQSESELLELTKANQREKILLQEKQVSEIENLKLQTRSIILIVTLILLTLIGLLFYGQRKLKFEKQSLQLQQRLFRSQMNPHFTYNTLYAIQNEIRKNPKNAEDYLVKFSRLLRLILENSMNNYVLLEKEIEAIRKYLDLQLIRSPDKFSYDIIFKNFEEDEFVFIPPMLLQPIIENSIEHGFSDIDYPGKLTISLTIKDQFIDCCIEDNGKGLQVSKQHDKQSASTQLITEFLQKATKQNFVIEDKKNSSETGILVQFLIPYKLTEDD